MKRGHNRLYGYEGNTFDAYFWFVGWDAISLGVSVFVNAPNIEIHLPCGFIRVGWRSKPARAAYLDVVGRPPCAAPSIVPHGMTWQVSSASGDPIAAAHARGIIEGRKMQAEEDAQIVRGFPEFWQRAEIGTAWDDPACNEIAAAIRSAAAKIGDDNG